MSNMVVRTNVLAMNSHRNLGNVGTQQARSSARLSSGFRINSAADDAAGLGISENMRAQIRGLDQASRNAQDGISLAQTAEGGLNTINEMIIRIRELTVQASNDINTSEGAAGLGANESNRARIQGEINHLIDEIQRTAETLQFNGMTLLDGSLGGSLSMRNIEGDIDGLTVEAGGVLAGTSTVAEQEAFGILVRIINQVGGANVQRLVEIFDEHDIEWDDDLSAILDDIADAIGDLDLSDPADREALTDLTWAITTVTRFHEAFQVHEARLGELADDFDDWEWDGTLEGIGDTLEDLFLDGGAATLNEGIWLQVGANSDQGIEIDIPDIVQDVAYRLRELFASPEFGMVTNNSESGNIATGNGDSITALIDQIDAIFADSTAARGALGAIQNRIEFTIQNLQVSSENLSAANSRIRDTDMAAEMMRLTQANVLQQAATAMLAQGNQAPQSILQLLG